MQDARRCKLGVAERELGRGDSNAVFSPPSIHTQLLHYRQNEEVELAGVLSM